MTMTFKFWLAASAVALCPAAALAQSHAPDLVTPASYGTVHEVTGAQILIAAPDGKCPARSQPVPGGPCFDKVLPAIGAHGVVLGLHSAPHSGDRVAGDYGRDFTLYDVSQGPGGLQVHALDLPTSNLFVPRNCYALPGEGVGYRLGVNGAYVAQESQYVACDGGARQPHGPYDPDGPVLASDKAGGWHRSETARLAGDRRYLAEPAACDARFSLKTTWCAEPAIRYLMGNPGTKELDLVAALHGVQPGDLLGKKEIDQWVLKRKNDHAFKADSRWFDKSMLGGEDGCTALEDAAWRVTGESDGLYVHEEALSRCGAPPAPVPADIYAAYGDDYYIVDCSGHHGWRDHHGHDDDSGHGAGCFDDAGDYLHRSHRSSATVVVLNDRARGDDHLHAGGDLSYDVANVYFDKDGHVQADRLDSYDPNISLNNCTAVGDGDGEQRGFVLVRSMGTQWARAYQWMSCPVY